MYWVWLLVGFVGRIRRGEYALGNFLLGLIASALAAVQVGEVPAAVVLLVPHMALTAKRLHDLGLSMVLAVVPLAALIGILVLTWDHGPQLKLTVDLPLELADAPVLVLVAIGVLFGLWLAFARGAPAPNAYGERVG